MSDTVVNPCFAVEISIEDTTYRIKQVDNIYSGLPPATDNARKSISKQTLGLAIKGYVNTENLEIGVDLIITGVLLTQLYGVLEDGVGASIDLDEVKGEVKLYLKNGNEVWIDVDLKVTFGGPFKKSSKVISF